MITIEFIEQINFILGIGGLVTLLATFVLIVDLKTKCILSSYIKEWGMHLALLITLGATILTLVYSEIFGLIPCGLCWFERIALYPQVLLLSVALYYKDTLVPRYGIVLSLFGLILSLYHHYIQMGGSDLIPCPASAADCAKRFMFELGFITFPLLAAILFAFLIALYVYTLKVRSH